MSNEESPARHIRKWMLVEVDEVMAKYLNEKVPLVRIKLLPGPEELGYIAIEASARHFAATRNIDDPDRKRAIGQAILERMTQAVASSSTLTRDGIT